jgi:two-component system chemotaxis sensor kinase CheA
MDVVRTNVEKIGGSIEMVSIEGKGTTFTIKIPLTLAIVSALIVGAGGERFAIPQLSISELVMVNSSGTNQIETIDDALVLRLRGNILPLVYLSKILGITNGLETDYSSARYIVVVKVASCDFGIVVDNVSDMEEIVVKPLTPLLKHLQIFSGNTILGDGQVIMILDPMGILKLIGASEMGDSTARLTEQDDDHKTSLANREKLFLLVKVDGKTVKAVSLERISRLEEVSVAKIEDSNGSPVIQYNGQLMPVHTYSGALPDRERCPLIIFNHDNKVAGLFADEILDIAKYYGDLSSTGSGKILDSIIINDHATDVINSEWYTAQGVVLEERA